MTTLALVGFAQISGLFRVWKTLRIRKVGVVARLASTVVVRRLQRKPEGGMQRWIDPSLAEHPVFIRRKVARLAIQLRNRFKAVLTFVAVDTGRPFHRTKPRFTLLVAVCTGGDGVETL